MATIEDFLKLDIRVGKVIEVQDFPEAKKPAYTIKIDFGEEIGIKNSSVQIVALYTKEELVGKLVLGVVTTPLHALVQGAGAAWRIRATAFRREQARSPALRRGLNRYLYVLMAQLATSAACLRFHQTGPRLARRLLMSQDRADSDSFRVTQEFLGCMLGVRRVSITKAAGALQRSGLIEYHRGHFTVLDRGGLEAAACSCYTTDRTTYADSMH